MEGGLGGNLMPRNLLYPVAVRSVMPASAFPEGGVPRSMGGNPAPRSDSFLVDF